MDSLLKEKTLNFISLIVFLIAFIASVCFVLNTGIVIDQISAVDAIVLVLATYRISRMIVYEKIFSLVRHFISKNSGKALFASVNNLITCPWCTAVWIALFLFDIYWLVPYGDYFVYIMSISALATPLVLISNALTLRNDILKKRRDSM
ncbi:MAG TPA: DUF1360 domain-containing protein [Bacteroidales bacterium]|nr:DUF1360 domain-containing protein [Bacteroidales bacterium]